MQKKNHKVFFPQASYPVRWADGAARKMCGGKRERRRGKIAKRNVVAIFASFVLSNYYTSYGNNVSVCPTSHVIKSGQKMFVSLLTIFTAVVAGNCSPAPEISL